MTIESHPNCERCNFRASGPHTPADFAKMLAPSTKEVVENPTEIVEAAADVDALVARADAIKERWGAAQIARSKLHHMDPSSRDLDTGIDAERVALERVGEQLTAARVKYHDLVSAFHNGRRLAEQQANTAANEAARIEERTADEKRRMASYKRLMGRNKAVV